MPIFDILSNDIGIDLGTANTLVFVKGRGIILNEPSVVAVEIEGGKVIAIGHDAREMLGRTPGHIRAVRPLKDGVIADFTMTEEMLREFIRKVIRKRFLVKPRIVISVPSGITEVERRAVTESAENAGARDVFLVNEPMAAAIGVGIPVEEPRGNMIIDIGGGTSEIAVIALSGIVNNTSIRIAGDEMDEAIINYLKKKYSLAIGENTAERVKREIGSAYPLPGGEEFMEVKGRDVVDGLPKTLKISSAEIREGLDEPVRLIMQALRQALEATPPELASDIVDRGIVMTGGGSLLRGLDQRIREETNLPVYVVDDPLTCVVMGTGRIINDTAKYSKLLAREKK
ncbi:MAG TPA: rod shape-determining protein [candidate division Zixibacteria bacterium]|nr:rod shape-determining protein [candidate division Zixibacteria bacterium]